MNCSLMTLCLLTLSKGHHWALRQILRAPLISFFQIQISKLMRQMLIPLKTQLDFFYPFPYISSRKYSVGNETIATGAVADADYTPPHNGWGWMCGRVVGCATSLTRKQSSPQSWLKWSGNCSCKKSRRELCDTLDSSQGPTLVSLLCCFSTNNHALREILFPLPKFVYSE